MEKGFFRNNNAKIFEKIGNESHLLQVATEFYTDKIKKMIPDDPTLYLSPFMMDTSHLNKNKKRLVLSNTQLRIFRKTTNIQ
ncbi:hypothetical protein CN380_21545 [Bacillus sp. AFS017274]|nr:hypothetical protein CN380_21545 [Bacillus sp. AFS017274]